MLNSKIRCGGPEARACLQELNALIQKEFPDWQPRLAERSPSASPPAGQTKADSLAVIALVLSVPASIMTALDLAERIKLKQKIDRLLQWIKTPRAAGQAANPFLVVPKSGKAIPLEEDQAAQIIEALLSESQTKK